MKGGKMPQIFEYRDEVYVTFYGRERKPPFKVHKITVHVFNYKSLADVNLIDYATSICAWMSLDYDH